MILSSIWIGYGAIVNQEFWSSVVNGVSFSEWYSEDKHYDCQGAMIESDLNCIIVALATCTKIFAESMGLIELPYDTVFALDDITTVIPQERLDEAQHQWERFRQHAQDAGYLLPTGRVLFAHNID